MILDEDSAQERLQSPKNLANKLNRIIAGQVPIPELVNPTKVEIVEEVPVVRTKIETGRNQMMSNLSPLERTVMGVMIAKGEATGTQAAKAFNVTAGTALRAAHGKTQGADNERIAAARQERVVETQDLAMNKLLTSLGLMTEDKMANAKLTDLSRVAVDMSRVFEKTLPKETNNGTPVVQLTLYCPTIKSEREYKVVDVTS